MKKFFGRTEKTYFGWIPKVCFTFILIHNLHLKFYIHVILSV